MIFPIIILGLILRSVSLNQSLWLDEAINVLAAKNYSFIDLITQYARADFHPPGWFIILWIWTKLFGYWEIVVRIPSVIFGVVTIYVTYLLGKKIYSKMLGIIASFMIAINPLHIFYSQEARMYGLATLAVVVNFFLFTKLVKGERLKIFYLVISNLLLLSSDYVAYLAFPAQLTFLIFNRQRSIFIIWIKGVVIALLLGIWWMPVFLSQFNVGSIASANLPSWKLIVGGFDIKTTALTLVKFIIGRISLSNKLIYYLLLLPTCLMFLSLILRGVKFAKNPSRNLLLSWLLVPIILATLISFVVPLYSYFRVLFVLPAFIILLSLGILSLHTRLRLTFLIVVSIIQLVSASIYLLNSSYHREDWRGVVSYLKTINGNYLVLFESSGTLPPFDYYSKNSLNAAGALKDFPARSSNDLIDFSSIQNTKDIYLVNYLVEVSDPQRLVGSKLDQLGYKVVETKDFTGVGFVYHYVRN